MAYGLTYSFPVEEEEEGRAPRAAPLAPAVDTLHTYSALSQPVARFLGDRRALKPGWAKAMPLMLRQVLAQRVSTAVITRLEQVGGQAVCFVYCFMGVVCFAAHGVGLCLVWTRVHLTATYAHLWLQACRHGMQTSCLYPCHMVL